MVEEEYLRARIQALRKADPMKEIDDRDFAHADGYNEALDDVLKLLSREVAMAEYFRASQALGQFL